MGVEVSLGGCRGEGLWATGAGSFRNGSKDNLAPVHAAVLFDLLGAELGGDPPSVPVGLVGLVDYGAFRSPALKSSDASFFPCERGVRRVPVLLSTCWCYARDSKYEPEFPPDPAAVFCVLDFRKESIDFSLIGLPFGVTPFGAVLVGFFVVLGAICGIIFQAKWEGAKPFTWSNRVADCSGGAKA